MQLMNQALEEEPLQEGHLAAWHQELQDKVKEFPSWFPVRDDVIVPQWAVQVRPQHALLLDLLQSHDSPWQGLSALATRAESQHAECTLD